MKLIFRSSLFTSILIFGCLPIDSLHAKTTSYAVQAQDLDTTEIPNITAKSYDLQKLYEIISPSPFVINPDIVNKIKQCYGLEINELLVELISVAKSFSLSPLSNFDVGAAALGKSGTIYLGTNLEFLGLPLNETIHAEQFVITNARSHGEEEILLLAVT